MTSGFPYYIVKFKSPAFIDFEPAGEYCIHFKYEDAKQQYSKFIKNAGSMYEVVLVQSSRDGERIVLRGFGNLVVKSSHSKILWFYS